MCQQCVNVLMQRKNAIRRRQVSVTKNVQLTYC